MNLDLKAYRCPDAQIMVNKILRAFAESEHEKIEITSIEPSLKRSIRERIAHFELPISLVSVEELPITQSDLDAWSEDFDEDYFGDVSVKSKYLLVAK